MNESKCVRQELSVETAVEIIMRLITKKARRENLEFFRERQGDVFADQVAARVLERWKPQR